MERILELNVGTNFTIAQLDKFLYLNQQYKKVKIAGVYGGLRTDVLDIPSARPDFRIADTDLHTFEQFVRLASENGIEVEFAANATFNSSVEELYARKRKLIGLFKYLENVGVKRVILSNPLLMEIVSEYTNLKLKISTILGVNKPAALKYYAKYHNVDNICPDIYINRDLPLLAEMQKEGKSYGMEMELLVNEICFYGDVPCSNILRSACYGHSSGGGNKNKLFDNWPFSRCQEERKKHPVCWLKIPCILPQHLRTYYTLTGISRFKVSGRTNTSEYLLKTVETYLSECFQGDITQLFMQPQNTLPDADLKFSVEKLEKMGHFDRWLQGSHGCDYHCHSCKHCEQIYERL